MANKAFKAGTTYTARSIGDANCVFEFTVIKRTACFITFHDGTGRGPDRSKIQTDQDGIEFCYPLGQYSMAPVIKADHPNPMSACNPNDHTLRACLYDQEAGRLLQGRCEEIAAGCSDEPTITLECRDGAHGTDEITTLSFDIDSNGCFSPAPGPR